MALRSKSKEDKKAPEEVADAPASPGSADVPQGPSVEECAAVGQALVQSGNLAGERLTKFGYFFFNCFTLYLLPPQFPHHLG